jgi:hypothetical protein
MSLDQARPSVYAYGSYVVVNIRMALDMEVQAGNQTAPLFAQPELWAFLDGLAEQDRPSFCAGTVIGERRKPCLE